MNKVSFRNIAKARLAQAKAELASADEQRLKYAALELRMAIEGLTYDRAQAFKAELPPAEYGTWQPKRVMQLLLDIDPWADQTVTFSMGLEESPGMKPKEMHTLGTDKVFNLKAVREHYDALGSFLHLQTLKQIEAGLAPDTKKFRTRCDALVIELEKVLASPVYNVTLGGFATFACQRCTKPIRRRMPVDAQETEVKCFECGAPHSLTRARDTSQVEIHSLTIDFTCLTTECGHIIPIWRDQIKPGASFDCPSCRQGYIVQLVALKATRSSPASVTPKPE